MTSPDSLIGHLLSHRLRGFDYKKESTVLGLQQGLKAGVRNVEFDVRFTRDHCPVAYHDPFFRPVDGTWSYIDEWDLAALRAEPALRDLATLDDMCACFADFHLPDALLHVDVKVGGYESVIHDTIEKFGLMSNTVLVSWLPDVLVQFHKLSPQTRLCFSHLPMARAPWLYGIAKAISPIVERAAPALSWGLRDIAPLLSHETLTVRLHFHDDGDVVMNAADADDAHLTPGHVVPGVLTGTMRDLLRKTDGMVCVPVALATPELRESYRSLDIQFAVYSVADMPSLNQVMTRIDPDIVYVDNADVIRAVAGAQAQIQTNR